VAIGKVLARGQLTLPRAIRRAARVQPGDTVLFRVTGPGTIELKVLPRLGLIEALERYRIEGPVDLNADRAEWQSQAARDVLGVQDD
jgi:bifunctional DNA-binding transcriptional regulator/antitoxin component of YhaV-PrlF toxin-antitoxin module